MLPTSVEWLLVGVVLTLGPYPVAMKSYPDQAQCTQAMAVLRSDGRIYGDCVRVLIPKWNGGETK